MGFFRRGRGGVFIWWWHNRTHAIKGVLEVLQWCKLAKSMFRPIGMDSSPLLIGKKLHHHITSFTSKAFSTTLQSVSHLSVKERKCFFSLQKNKNCSSTLHGTFTPEFVMHWRWEQVHDFCSTAGKHWTKASVKITEKRPIISGTNPTYESTEFGPLYFQGH